MLTRREQFAMAMSADGIEFPSIEDAANWAGLNPASLDDHEAMAKLSFAIEAKIKVMRADALIAELDRTGPEQESDPKGWINWSGGECPLTPRTLVEIETAVRIKRCGEAREFRWQHHQNQSDIMRYRLMDGEA